MSADDFSAISQDMGPLLVSGPAQPWSGWRTRADGQHGPHFDRAVAGGRDLRRPRERLVERVGLDEEEATELLLGLGERAVRHELLVIADPHRERCRCRLQRRAVDVAALLAQLVGEAAVLTDEAVPL